MSRATLTSLRGRLTQRLAQPLPADTWPGPEAMAEAALRINTLLAGAKPIVVDEEQLIRAIGCLQRKEQLTSGDLRLLCTGASKPVVIDGVASSVIDSTPLTTQLLSALAARGADPRLTRKCAFGLGHAVLAPSTLPEGEGLTNLQRLGATILAYCDGAAGEAEASRSPQFLADLREVWSTQSTRQFWPYVQAGDASVLAPVQRLAVPNASWLWHRTVAEAIEDVSGRADGPFAATIESILDTTAAVAARTEQESIIDRSTGLLLTRYSQMRERPEHERLKDLSVDRWGSPLISTRRPTWYRWCNESTRAMVAGWLARKVIASLFGALVGPHSDPRRARFWSRYADQIDEFHVYLSEQDRRGSEALAELRRNLGPSVRRVNDAVTSVFVMMIGEYAFVEFSATGNALYVYDRDQLPFEVECQDEYPSAFRDRSRGDRLTHQGYWEDRARDMVGSRTGVWPTR